jgi:protoporphyrinogen oxidase
MSADFEAFVIGAGPAGLTAAYCLTAVSRSVAVIERDPVYVGGISRTVRYKDFMFDIGGHRFFSKAREVVVGSWSPEMVPPGMSCLGLEYFCFEGDALWQASDPELIAMAKSEIGRIGLAEPEEVVDACVVRQPKAYPVYDDRYRDNLAMIRLDLKSSYPTLHLVGRNGMHKYNNQDHAMMTAMLTARNILAGEQLYDTWDVNEDAEYHEAGASGIREALRSERIVPEKMRRAVNG